MTDRLAVDHCTVSVKARRLTGTYRAGALSMTTDHHLVGLWRYPVKSLRGHALANAAIEPRGIAGDRRWMLVDPTGRFVTCREAPAMAAVDVAADDAGLILSHPGHGTCRVARPNAGAGAGAPRIEARIWRDTLSLRLADDRAGQFLSDVLGRPVRLAYQDDESRRAIDSAFAGGGDHVSLADGFPILVTTVASLDALNGRLPRPVGMDRFRPNLIIAGAAPWEEDRWRRIRIGGVSLRIAKPCSRCVITTQDPTTGVRADGNDPLTTLRAMGRAGKGGIMFGQNVVPEGNGTIAVGDRVEIVETGPSNLGAD